MKKLPAILVNYCYEPTWLKDYPNLEVTMYDRSDDQIERNLTQYGTVYKTENRGDVDFDKLSYLIENYDNLPEVFLWSKTNLFKYCDEETFKEALKTPQFTPLLGKDHRIYSDQYGPVNRYNGKMYEERNNSWFFNAGLDSSGRFNNWQEWCDTFNLPQTQFIPFAPGGSYLLTRERVHRYSRDFYEKMRDTLPYAAHPVEAHCCERSYFLLWR
jgi:hypothetical protein